MIIYNDHIHIVINFFKLVQVIFHQTCFGTEVSLLDEFSARIYEELDYNKVIQFPSPFSLNMGPFKGFIMKYTYTGWWFQT